MTSKKTLGVWDCPAGGNSKHLQILLEKMDIWLARMKKRHLPPHMAWMAYKLQLWDGLRCGIGTLTNDFEEAEEVLGNSDFEVLPLLGIARTINKKWRQIHSTFGGIGLFHFPTEQIVERLNIFLQHYHTSSALSRKRISISVYNVVEVFEMSSLDLENFCDWNRMHEQRRKESGSGWD